MATTQFYPNVTVANSATFVAELARWFIDDHPSITGPAEWEIVKAYDASQASAALRLRTPDAGDERNMDCTEFSHDAFGWQAGALGVGDWIVLRSGVGLQGTQFDLYLEYESTTVLNVKVCPFADFVGNDATPPTFPATSFGNGTGLTTLETYAGAARYSVIADESTAHICSDNTTTFRWMYVGELEAFRSGGTPPDDRCFVSRSRSDQDLYWGADTFSRCSPLDDNTVITTGRVGFWSCLDAANPWGGDTNLLGMYLICPIPLFFVDYAGHKHSAGWLRLCGYVPANAIGGAGGTLASLTYMKRGPGSAAIAFEWDGATTYP